MIRNRRAVTLVELLIAIAVLGVIAAMAGLSPPPKNELVSTPTEAIESARREAVRTGRTIRLRVSVGEASFAVSALPDGSVLSDSAVSANLTIAARRHDVAR